MPPGQEHCPPSLAHTVQLYVAEAAMHSQFLTTPKIGSPPKTAELQPVVVPLADKYANAGRAATRAINRALAALEPNVKQLFPGMEYLPAAQLVHAELPAVAYLPGKQMLQGAGPDDAFCIPATHCVQLPPPDGPDQPGLQMQASKAVLPVVEFLFAGQCRHVKIEVAPTVVEYVPAPQAVHADSEVCPVAFPYLPAPQAMHDASADPPVCTRYLPVPQAVHVEAAVAPTVVEYVPIPQFVHDASADPPVSTRYFPAPQTVHDTSAV